VLVRAGSEDEAKKLDELMWDYPPGRFLPHRTGPGDETVPVSIVGRESGIPGHRDLVINLCTDPVPEPQRLRRLCEIVPADPAQRTASRSKFRVYRDQGLSPEKHDLN
jgi:DNA polymerase-3 subunit chi